MELVILNDQGGQVMNTSENVAATLRAEDHGHPTVICFEPGILSRDCSSGNRAYEDICSTLRAQMGDNQPAICVLNFQGSKGNNVCTEDGKCYSLNAMHGHDTHVVCFRKSSKPGWTGSKEKWVEDVKSNTLNCFEFNSDVRTPQIVCYGLVTKGNGDAFLSKERHTSLSCGGGEAGQGYPAVCIKKENYSE